MRRIALAAVLVLSACRRTDPPAPPDAAPPSPSGAPSVVAEPLPRCRADGRELAIPGDDVVAGSAVLLPDALVVGVVRRDGGKRVASVVRAPLDLASVKVTDVGPAFGDDPPPVPYARGADVVVAVYARKKDAEDAGIATPGATRLLRLVHLDGRVEGTVVQQADESTAFDVAWPPAGPPLVAWDEDAPIAIGQFLADRGTVKVAVLGSSDKPRAIPAYATDAEQPRLLARGQAGYFLVWIARRGESEPDSGTFPPEGPAETRDRRWVELATLDAKGEQVGPIRRVSPDRGRVVSYDVAPAAGGAELSVLVQDEVEIGEGAGARLLRYAVYADRVEPTELVDGGVGRALAEVAESPAPSAVPKWLSWTDGAERAHLLALGPGLEAVGRSTVERALDRSRLVAATADAGYAVASEGGEGGGRTVLRRLTCR